MKRCTTLFTALVVLAALSAGESLAATTGTTFSVTATVAATCVVSASDLDFGAYDPSAGNHDSTTTVSVTCTNGTAYSVDLDNGSNYVTGRRMTDGLLHYLAYDLYSDSSHLIAWNTGGAASSGTGSAQAYTVYGRISGGQYVTPASYTDTITVTVNY